MASFTKSQGWEDESQMQFKRLAGTKEGKSRA